MFFAFGYDYQIFLMCCGGVKTAITSHTTEQVIYTANIIMATMITLMDGESTAARTEIVGHTEQNKSACT